MARGQQEIASLNGLRAISIIIVVWGHTGLPTIILGSTGVTVFFFISGYLITTLMVREMDRTGSVSVRDFYLRRFLRILPPLYVILVVAIVLSLTRWIPSDMTWPGVASGAFFFTNYYIIDLGRSGLVGGMNALWSLAVEEHYYVIFPVLFIALQRYLPKRRFQAAVLVALCGAVLVWRFILATHGAGYDRIYLATDTRIDGILAGAALALVMPPEKMGSLLQERRHLASLAAGVGAAAFFLIPRLSDGSLTYGYSLEALALALIFIAVIGSPRSIGGLILNWAPLRWIGLISYTVYLVHRPLLILAEEHVPGSALVGIALAIGATLVIAELMRRYVEEPCARIRRRLSHADGAPRPNTSTD